jgi:hypothetical protein
MKYANEELCNICSTSVAIVTISKRIISIGNMAACVADLRKCYEILVEKKI